MNKKQLMAMWIGIGIIVLMALFPPFCEKLDAGIYHFRGYHFFTTSIVKIQLLSKKEREEKIQEIKAKQAKRRKALTALEANESENWKEYIETYRLDANRDYSTIGIYLYNLNLETVGNTTWEKIIQDKNIRDMLETYGISDYKSLIANKDMKRAYDEYKKAQEIKKELEIEKQDHEREKKLEDEEIKEPTAGIIDERYVAIDNRRLTMQCVIIVFLSIGLIITFKYNGQSNKDKLI